jgi:hypothetical protein
MFKPIYKPYFILAVVLYALVHLARIGGNPPVDWINSYLTDFLCMPIILTLCLVGVRFIKRIPEFVLTPTMIFGMTIFYGILFEYILPSKNSAYTSDHLDVVMYFAGAGLYWFLWNRESANAVVEARA